MNTSFTRVPLVNTYGAFGSVGRERDQLVFEGTMDGGAHRRDDLARVRMEMPAGRSGAPPVLDRGPSTTVSTGASGSRRWAAPARRAVVGEPGLEAARRRSRGARPAGRPIRSGGTPPRHIRVNRYRYRFAPPGRRPSWWTRERNQPTGCRPSPATTRSCKSAWAGRGWLREPLDAFLHVLPRAARSHVFPILTYRGGRARPHTCVLCNVST